MPRVVQAFVLLLVFFTPLSILGSYSETLNDNAMFSLAASQAWAQSYDTYTDDTYTDGTGGTGGDSAAENNSSDAGFLKNTLNGSFIGKILFGLPFKKAAFADMLAVLLLAFVIAKILSRTNQGPKAGKQHQNFDFHSDNDQNSDENSGPCPPPPGFDPWARLRSKPQEPNPFASQNNKPDHTESKTPTTAPGAVLPFPSAQQPEDQSASPARQTLTPEASLEPDSEFIKGAKLLYIKIHEAWKNQDLAFIEHFTSPKVYEKYVQQSETSLDYIDIVKVDARIVREEEKDAQPLVTVAFTALAHHSKQAGPPLKQVDTWVFCKPTSTNSWRLEEKL